LRPVIRSDGTYVRDYFYVEDGAEAYLLLAERMAGDPGLRGQAFNFSNETPVSVIDLTQRIQQLMGSSLPPEIRSEASHEIRAQFLDANKARQVLGWAPRFSLDEGLRRTIAWYRDALAKDLAA
jgi:CDP-glucose 4,6-dehydratase